MNKISSKSMVLLLFTSCWVVYFISYSGRLNYSAAIPQLLSEGVLDKSQAGAIGTVYFGFYACGQLLNGLLGDRLKPLVMLVSGMLLSALANVFMALSGDFLPMCVAWGINGYAQAMIWPPMVYIFTSMLKKDTMVKCFTNLATSIAAGTLFAYFMSAMILKSLSWQWIFIAPSVLIIAAAFIFSAAFKRVKKHVETNGEYEPIESTGETVGGKSPVKMLLSPALLLLIIPVFSHGVIKDGLTAWVPTYINESFNAGPVTAVLVSMVLPVVNISGAYLAAFLKKIIKNEGKISAVLFSVAGISLLGIFIFGSSSLTVCLILLAVASACMLAVNTVYISYIPIKYAAMGRSSTISGFLNATAYGGAAISSAAIGAVSAGMGWNAVMLCFVIMVAIALIISLFFTKANYRPLLTEKKKSCKIMGEPKVKKQGNTL